MGCKESRGGCNLPVPQVISFTGEVSEKKGTDGESGGVFLDKISTGCSSERFNKPFLAPLGTLVKICQPHVPSGNWWGGGEMRPTDGQQVFSLSASSVSPKPCVRGYCSMINWSAGENCLTLWFYGHVIVRGGKSPEQLLLLTLLLHMCLVQQHLLNAILL